MIITEQLFLDGVNGGTPNSKQLAIFNMKWPLRHGWMKKIVGRNITDDQYLKFLSLRKQYTPSEKPWPTKEEWNSFEPSEETKINGFDLEAEAWL